MSTDEQMIILFNTTLHVNMHMHPYEQVTGDLTMGWIGERERERERERGKDRQ